MAALPPTFSKPVVSLDGFCDKPLYQMVPKGDGRPVSFTAGGDGCEVIVKDFSIAGVTDVKHSSGVTVRLDKDPAARLVVNPKTKIEFTIKGLNSGTTFLEYRSTKGQCSILEALQVCVKEKKSRTVGLVSIEDGGGNKPTWSSAQVTKAFDAVRRTFLQQCNLELKHTTQHRVVKVQERLRNPFVPDDAGANRELALILFAIQEQAADVKNSDILVLFLWNIKGTKDPEGLELAAMERRLRVWKPNQKLILFDDSLAGANFVLAHEFGHAFGLEHNTRKGSLMYPVTGSSSSQLEQHEIDTVNPDGVLSE